jgi:YfiH family protein
MSDEVLFAGNLTALSGAKHAFFTRSWENQSFSEAKTMQEAISARASVAAYFKVLPQNLLCCRQIHSPDVVTVGDIWEFQNAPEADAMVTNKSGIALGILTADCAPVLLAASNLPVIGAAHAGWRGALGGVLENTLKAMEKLGAQRRCIHAALGPCIGQKSYEVGPEFPMPFLAENKSNERFFMQNIKNGKYLFDLQGYIINKLNNLGIGLIESVPFDTCADPDRFFSYRYSTLRGEKCAGRLISAIVLN